MLRRDRGQLEVEPRATARLTDDADPALVRLAQKGWIRGTWQKTENKREAEYYAITKAGTRALDDQTERWRRFAGLLDKLLLDELKGCQRSADPSRGS